MPAFTTFSTVSVDVNTSAIILIDSVSKHAFKLCNTAAEAKLRILACTKYIHNTASVPANTVTQYDERILNKIAKYIN